MRVIFLIASLLFLTACGEQIHVKTTLNATQDVSEGDVVFLSNEVVGEIANVSQLDGKTVLDIELSEKGAGLVKRQAAVVINRLKPNLPVEIYNKRNAVEAVQHGQELQGLSSMFQLGAWMVGDSLKIGDGHGDESLLGYVDAFQRYLQGEQFKEDKKVLEQGIEQLGKEAEGMAKVLNQEMEKATEDLAKAEDKAAEVVTQLGNELAPVMGELAKSGKAISDELEKFVKNLENQNAEGKEVGASVLTSLLIALERVNSEIEKQSITRSDPEKETNQQRQNDVPPDANTASQASSDNSINQTVEPTEKPVMPSEDADAGVNADSNPQQEPTLQTEQDKENVKQL